VFNFERNLYLMFSKRTGGGDKSLGDYEDLEIQKIILLRKNISFLSRRWNQLIYGLETEFFSAVD